MSESPGGGNGYPKLLSTISLGGVRVWWVALGPGGQGCGHRHQSEEKAEMCKAKLAGPRSTGHPALGSL